MAFLTIDDLKKDHRVLYELALKHRYNQHKRDNTDQSVVDSFNWSHCDAEGYNFWSYISSGDFIKAYELRPDLKTPTVLRDPSISKDTTVLTVHGIKVGDWYVATDNIIMRNEDGDNVVKGTVINIIDIDVKKFLYYISPTEYIPNLQNVLLSTRKCPDRASAEIYAYELLHPANGINEPAGNVLTPMQKALEECKKRFKIGMNVISTMGSKFMIDNVDFKISNNLITLNYITKGDCIMYDHTNNRYASESGECVNKLDECKKIYKIGDVVTNHYGSVFTIENLNFFTTNSDYITYNRTGISNNHSDVILWDFKGFATVTGKVNPMDKVLEECKRIFSPGDKIKSLGGMVFILSNEKIETASNYVCVKNQNNLTVGGRFYPNIASLKEDGTIMYAELLEKDCKLEPEPSNLHEYEKNKQRMIDALNHIKRTFLKGMSIRTDLGDEFDLVGDFEFTLDEDDDCIYLEDEGGDYFCVYDFEDGVYPTIIESVIHEPGIIDTSNVFWKEIKPMPSFKKEIKESSLEASLVLLPVKSLTIN